MRRGLRGVRRGVRGAELWEDRAIRLTTGQFFWLLDITVPYIPSAPGAGHNSRPVCEMAMLYGCGATLQHPRASYTAAIIIQYIIYIVLYTRFPIGCGFVANVLLLFPAHASP